MGVYLSRHVNRAMVHPTNVLVIGTEFDIYNSPWNYFN
jgi:hypothetical protein